MVKPFHVLATRIDGQLARFIGEYSDAEFEAKMAELGWVVPTGMFWYHIESETDPRWSVLRNSPVVRGFAGRLISTTEALERAAR